MMTDRFDAQLRQHLLDTANERPADGQIAAVVDQVAVTRQRPSIAARLTWFPGRVGPVPAAGIRYAFIALALALAAVAGALLAGGGSQGQTAFEGTWTSIDPFDGSTQWLFVGPGSHPTVRYEDDWATGGACVGDAVKHFVAVGSGRVDGDRLEVAFPEGGGCGLQTVSVDALSLKHRSDTDTLVDGTLVVWQRTDAPVAEPTGATTAEPTPQPTPEPSAPATGCVDLTEGGTYSKVGGRLALTATIPAAPVNSWWGTNGSFQLMTSCAFPSMTFHAGLETALYRATCMPGAAEVTTFEEAIARLDGPQGDDISDRMELTIDGHRAARYDVEDLATCADGFGLWTGTSLGYGETGSVYVIDVDGLLLAIELNRSGLETPAQLQEAWAIIESLQMSGVDGPVDPTEAPAGPTVAPVEPTAPPVDPTLVPLDATSAPVEATEAPGASVET